MYAAVLWLAFLGCGRPQPVEALPDGVEVTSWMGIDLPTGGGKIVHADEYTLRVRYPRGTDLVELAEIYAKPLDLAAYYAVERRRDDRAVLHMHKSEYGDRIGLSVIADDKGVQASVHFLPADGGAYVDVPLGQPWKSFRFDLDGASVAYSDARLAILGFESGDAAALEAAFRDTASAKGWSTSDGLSFRRGADQVSFTFKESAGSVLVVLDGGYSRMAREARTVAIDRDQWTEVPLTYPWLDEGWPVGDGIVTESSRDAVRIVHVPATLQAVLGRYEPFLVQSGYVKFRDRHGQGEYAADWRHGDEFLLTSATTYGIETEIWFARTTATADIGPAVPLTEPWIGFGLTPGAGTVTWSDSTAVQLMYPLGSNVESEADRIRAQLLAAGAVQPSVTAYDSANEVPYLSLGVEPPSTMDALGEVPLTAPWDSMDLPIGSGQILTSDAAMLTVTYIGSPVVGHIDAYTRAITDSGWSLAFEVKSDPMTYAAVFQRGSQTLTVGMAEVEPYTTVALALY